MNKKLLFITTQYRVGERIYPVIPSLAKEFDIDLLLAYQMDPNFRWVGNFDNRKEFLSKYKPYFKNILTYSNTLQLNQYDLIIADDNRASNGLDQIYAHSTCPMIGCKHGNGEEKYEYKNLGKCYDFSFVFGKKECLTEFNYAVGIPSNDLLKQYKDIPKEYVLIVSNFLGNRWAPLNFKTLDKNFFDTLDLPRLQKKYNLPIVIKLKSRDDEGGHKHNIDYLNSILDQSVDYKILVDVEDDNLLMAKSAAVITPPSTFAYKPIQLGIPTIILNGYGQINCFEDYKFRCELEEVYEYLDKFEKTNFVSSSIEGGEEFNSTECFINAIKDVCTHTSSKA